MCLRFTSPPGLNSPLTALPPSRAPPHLSQGFETPASRVVNKYGFKTESAGKVKVSGRTLGREARGLCYKYDRLLIY